MQLKGEDVSDALRTWIRTDIQEIGKTGYDLGKFQFTMVATSMGLVATLQKLEPTFKPSFWNLLPYVPLAFALLLSLNLVLPRDRVVKGDTDLHALYVAEVTFLNRRVWTWFFFWLGGMAWSLWQLFKA